ncbi:MAG: hypothetical protein R6U04_06350 [Bacteroidales bacterium]
MDKTLKQILLWLFLFAVSMGLFEASIVVYLRELYYPEGFSFPLTPVDRAVGITEILREIISMLMIISVAVLAFKNFYRQFAAFIFIFAIWDIFYYVFLKLILDWPESLLTWDILYLIPVAWTGPVLAPVLISLIMILLFWVIIYFDYKNAEKFNICMKEWGLLIAGAFVVFISFIWDYSVFLISQVHISALFKSPEEGQSILTQYTPDKFNWFLFSIGTVVILAAIFFIYKRNAGSREYNHTYNT